MEPVQPALLVPVEDLVAGAPGDAELPAQRRHLLAFEQAGYESEAFIHRLTLVPGHLEALTQMRKCVNHVLGINCKLSVDKLRNYARSFIRPPSPIGPVAQYRRCDVSTRRRHAVPLPAFCFWRSRYVLELDVLCFFRTSLPFLCLERRCFLHFPGERAGNRPAASCKLLFLLAPLPLAQKLPLLLWTVGL